MSKQIFAIASPKSLREVMMLVWNSVCALVNDEQKGVKITVQTASKRSLEQNDRLHAMLGEVAQQVEWHGRKLDPVAWKRIFGAALKKQEVVPGLDGEFVVIGVSTAEMSAKECGEMMELIEAFGVTNGVRFSAPEWREERSNV
jgi:hypothetical protein